MEVEVNLLRKFGEILNVELVIGLRREVENKGINMMNMILYV